ncbi:uncharacterized protein K444DRAFT_663807 [Hyaloscypha bicolor E]|jgi:hypothetical protein|uniref:Uncharacterized protein n=1 Tax=Hyaloscypha bicolor E TaxID=1095630 RepID=A0A2J6T8N3_9HELO|nr:uncharacterized protein K444DRAFT_663807 [Hyaloscypha bicolor E]PMD59376.1 hypothetical protein K444DRAFT_663807 [Hyaloscypha bicolor E]
MAQSFLQQSRLHLGAGRLLRQLYQGSKALFELVEIHINSPAGYLLTGLTFFLAGTFRGQWLLGNMKPEYFKILSSSKRDPLEATIVHTQLTDGSITLWSVSIPATNTVNKIRLLELMPRSQANPTSVNCNFHHFSLKEIQPYVCPTRGARVQTTLIRSGLVYGGFSHPARCTKCCLMWVRGRQNLS